MKIVIDTNVMVTALKSNRGASFKLLSILTERKYVSVVSVPLIIEYESVLKRTDLVPDISHKDIDDFIDYLCTISEHQDIYYLWRPFLSDPFDDHILEVAVASKSNTIITYNKKDFNGIETFGLRVLDPKEFLLEIGEIS